MHIPKLWVWGILSLTVVIAPFSCKDSTSSSDNRSFLDFSSMDTTIKPGEDFFSYANGNWYRQTVIPSDQAGWSTVHVLFEDNRKKLHSMLDELAAGQTYAQGTPEQMMGDLYAGAMDSAAIDRNGYAPLADDLNRIEQITSVEGLVKECAYEYTVGDENIFGVFVAPDDRDATVNKLQFFQDGLSLPTRDYYLYEDSASVNIRNEFVQYVAGMFKAIGADSISALTDASAILELETKLAKAHVSQVELRDPVKNYNKFALKDLAVLAPEINWTAFITGYGVTTDSVLVGQPGYFKELSRQLKATPVRVWKNKLKLKLVEQAPLGDPFEELKFSFYSKMLRGIQERPARWKKATRMVNDLAGDLLGRLYVKKYFPEDAKKKMLVLVNNLQQVYESRIHKLDWMGDSTRQKALLKLKSFEKKIGYPDKWKDYAGVQIVRNNHFNNVRQLKIYKFRQELAKVDKPVDKTEWFMNAAEVNAYYNPSFNEIVFPAGILQPPFFDPAADDAVNYGAIGAIIGHEMTHGFDDQGRQYDADGNLRDWWTAQDAEQFKQRAKVVIDQYNAYTVLDSLHVNGALTLGENIADIGGLMIAYEAFKNTPQGRSDKKIDGYTPDQRFFLSYAVCWRSKFRDETIKERLLTDPHSPERFRANGSVSCMPEFYEAFAVQPGDKMYRADSIRVKIW
ncbi:MAG: M13 family metallopeptidase [Chitinophagaceae bacterium]|nr:M13 family metallopeptidase [Chitinophagaceae bacterium]